MNFRIGDVATPQGPLRLTVSGLAELAERLAAPNAQALADHVRVMSPDIARRLLKTLLRPSGRVSQVARLSDSDVAACLPDITRCLVTALDGDGTVTPSSETRPQPNDGTWPFAAWHRMAICHLGLAPSEFWALPLADWLALITPQKPSFDRAELDALMKDYPDD